MTIAEGSAAESMGALGSWGRLAFGCFGARICVLTSRTDLLHYVRDRLPPSSREREWADTERTCVLLHRSDGYTVWAPGGRLVSSTDLDAALGSLGALLDHFVASASRDAIFVHAGVVGWRGRAIVIPGRTGSGKTTLVSALLDAGATYYSDEYAPIDEEGRVHAYPRRLGVRDPGTARLPQRFVEPPTGRIGESPLPVGLVVVATYRAGASTWHARRMSAAAGVVSLFDQTVAAREQPERALEVLCGAVRGAEIVEVERGEAHLVAPALLELLDGRREP